MHYIFDFDSTLFANSRLWESWVSMLENEGLEKQFIIDEGVKLIQLGFSPQKHADAVGLENKISKKLVSKFSAWIEKEGPELIYTDVPAFFERKNGDHKYSILTFGDPEFQDQKIQACQLYDLVDDVYVATPEKQKKDHLADLVSGGADQVLFVDDNPNELEAVHGSGVPVTLVRILRDGEYHAQEKHKGDGDLWQCIESLEELDEIM
ncbi:MAG: HAD hydrolase-like protein [Patescibacteria group bacterium]